MKKRIVKVFKNSTVATTQHYLPDPFLTGLYADTEPYRSHRLMTARRDRSTPMTIQRKKWRRTGAQEPSIRKALIAACALLSAQAALIAPATAHHSYAAFDPGKRATVEGSVAKLEWTNPHSYLWVYVANKGARSGYDLYGFESGPPAMMTRFGWSKTILKSGERLSVEYTPLKNGGKGGHLNKVTLADGRVLAGDAFAVGAATKPAANP